MADVKRKQPVRLRGAKGPVRKPDLIPIGSGVRLVSVRALAQNMGMTHDQANTFLRSLFIPTLTWSGSDREPYFNLASLEAVLYYIAQPGRRSWITTTLSEEVRQDFAEGKWRDGWEAVSREYRAMDEEQMVQRLKKMKRAPARRKERNAYASKIASSDPTSGS